MELRDPDVLLHGRVGLWTHQLPPPPSAVTEEGDEEEAGRREHRQSCNCFSPLVALSPFSMSGTFSFSPSLSLSLSLSASASLCLSLHPRYTYSLFFSSSTFVGLLYLSQLLSLFSDPEILV